LCIIVRYQLSRLARQQTPGGKLKVMLLRIDQALLAGIFQKQQLKSTK
jgi:hypothetical protein